MSKEMFCFQCEQTAGCNGCHSNVGVCGKNSNIAKLQDELTGTLIGLAHTAKGHTPVASTHKAMLEGLFTTITNVNFNEETILEQIKTVTEEKNALVHQRKNYNNLHDTNNNYNMENLWNANEDIRSLKSLILFGLRGMAAYACHALILGYQDDEVNAFFYEGLSAVGEDLDLYPPQC